MDFNRFTEKLQEGIRAAQSVAASRGQQQIDVEHLLIALLEQDGGLTQSILAKSGVKLTMLAFVIKASVAALKKFPAFNSSLDAFVSWA